MKGVNGKVAGMKVALKLELEMPKGWIDKMETWIVKSLRKSGYKIILKLQKKFDSLRKQQQVKQKENKGKFQQGTKKKVVYSNGSRKLSKEHFQLLSLGLNFGLTPKTFPLAEYVQATELLCQRLEEGDEEESVQKARAIKNEVFNIHATKP